MGYGRGNGYRRRYKGYRYRTQGPSKYSALSGLFGSMVGNIRTAFLQLEEDALEELFEDYGNAHGDSAAKYAKKTFPKWKSGVTNLSGQTMERLIELVPPYLSPEQRFNLVTEVLRKHKPNNRSRTVKINVERPQEGFEELENVLTSMTHGASLVYLPERVLEAAKWLNDDDVTASRAMLAEVERRENDIMRASAAKEISLLRRTIASGQVKSASYSVTMPAGTLFVVAFKPSMCFVATMCFGKESREVAVLRSWRDNVLLESDAGRAFVVWYYQHGEYLANIIGRSNALLACTRKGLKMVVKLVNVKNSGETV